LLESEAELK